MKKILILGGGGFIGGHLGKYMKALGNYVSIIDIKPHKYFKQDEICDYFQIGDLCDIATVRRLLNNSYDEIYQLASDVGGAGYIHSGQNDADIMSNSAQININIAKTCAEYGVKKLFFSSSSCAYPKPDSNYGLEKQFSERLYLSFAKTHGLNIRIGRFQNVYGSHDAINDSRERFIIAICRKIVMLIPGGMVEVWGNGEQMRSFIHVSDCINEIMVLMSSDCLYPVNIGTEKLISINDVVSKIIRLSDKKLNIYNIFGKEFKRKYGYKCPVGTETKILSDNFTNEISEIGLRSTYDWVKNILHEN